MRVVIVTVIILIIFFVGAFIVNRCVNNTCVKLLEDARALDRSIKKEDWARGKKQVHSFQKQWEGTKKCWLLFMEHYETDPIDIVLTRLEQYIEVEDKALALGEMAELKLLIDSVRSKENFKLENIL